MTREAVVQMLRDMLKKEHAIFKLWSAINPLLPQGGRRLLSIY